MLQGPPAALPAATAPPDYFLRPRVQHQTHQAAAGRRQQPRGPPAVQQQLLLSLAGAVLALAAACPQPAQAASFGSRPPYRPGPEARAPAGKSVGQRAVEVIGLSAEAQAASDGGDYAKALEAYQTIVRDYSDLALSQKAHVGLALVLYQQGQHAEALAELKSVEFRLRGNPELHAALAAMLYSQQPPALNRAEEQFEVASEFGQRSNDLSTWVRWAEQERRWPPAVVAALQRFLSMS